jgi:nucleoside-diphosphate-sugar epimerase
MGDEGIAMNHLLCFGFGFSAQHLASLLDKSSWRISGTSRSVGGAHAINELGYEGVVFADLTSIPKSVTHILSSVPPDKDGDPVLRNFSGALAEHATNLGWAAYLSTTGVYGDRAAATVDETADLRPNGERGQRRVDAEKQWQAILNLPLHIFRLPGIYGAGRSQLDAVRDGTARRIVKPGQIFSRIHVEDIAGILKTSIDKPNPGRIYNVADDEACPPQDVVSFACELLNVAPPPETPFEQAELSPMARSFYADSKRVSNARIKSELHYKLKYPTYREGLKALLNR